MSASGAPTWAGSRNVAESIGPRRLAARHGAVITSRKRPANHPLSIANPGSDHNEANTTAYAIDFATFTGKALAHAIARRLGIDNYRTGTFESYTIHRGGATFRVQILWDVSGHLNHVHLGIKLVGGNFTPPRPRPPVMRPRSRTYGRWGRLLKRKLRRRGHKGLWVRNGFYRPGSPAVEAVKKFQRRHNLKPDGVVGRKTWNALGE